MSLAVESTTEVGKELWESLPFKSTKSTSLGKSERKLYTR